MELIVQKPVLVFDHKGGKFFSFPLDKETSHGRKLSFEFPFDVANESITNDFRKCIKRVSINGTLHRLSIMSMFDSGTLKSKFTLDAYTS